MNVLILGDTQNALYHPLDQVEQGLNQALLGIGNIHVCSEYKQFGIQELLQYDVIISYLDNYKQLEGFDDVLEEYAAAGGKLLALHNGIITSASSKLEAVYGGRFITHPPRCELEFITSGWAGQETICLNEEPYMVETKDKDNQVFLQFEYQGNRYDAGWVRRYKKGFSMYLEPGHDQKTTEKKEFQKLLKECVQFLYQLN